MKVVIDYNTEFFKLKSVQVELDNGEKVDVNPEALPGLRHEVAQLKNRVEAARSSTRRFRKPDSK
jgi:hypothetical protein